MDATLKEALWSQFGAAMEMLGNGISACPDELWTASMWNDPAAPPGFSEFWYVTYHTLFWLDLYLSGSEEGFMPPAPYTLGELEAGVLPERVYRRDELLTYLAYCRSKCRQIIDQLTDEGAARACEFPWSKGTITYIELLLDNMRHVQEHGAQLNMFLGQQADKSARWVARTRGE